MIAEKKREEVIGVNKNIIIDRTIIKKEDSQVYLFIYLYIYSL